MVTKVKHPDIGKVAHPNQEHIVGVTTKADAKVAFDPPGGTVNRDAIQGKVKSVDYSVQVQDVQRLWIEDQRGFRSAHHRTLSGDRREGRWAP